MSTKSSAYLETAIAAAKAAGSILMKHFREISQEDVREKRKNDFLTFVDESAEEQILAILRDAYPEHGFLAEESGLSEASREFQWIIDPLDGTKNYISGIPVFAVSIALSIRNEIHTGVVFDPVHQELFFAEKNLGAYLNDKRIRVNQTIELEKSLVATGFPFRYKSVLGLYMKCFEDIFRHSSGARRMGAAALDMAGVACGRFEGFWELGLKPWDMAAGSLLVTEAGGSVTDFWNGAEFLDRSYMVATNGKIHGDLITIIRKHFPEYKSLTQDG